MLQPMHRRRGTGLVVGLVVLFVALAACGGSTHPAAARSTSPSSSASSSPPASPAVRTASYGWYLSIGDSLAFGYQQTTFDAQRAAGTVDPSAYDTGYADLIAARLEQLDPALVTVNLGCPAETTATYLHGGCPAQRGGLLHDTYAGSQAAAAEAFLAARSGPGLVTVSLGANDALDVLSQCSDLSTSCVLPKLFPALSAMQANLETALRAVHAAAPAATVLVLEPYDPYVEIDSRTVTAIGLLDGDIATAAAATGARTVDARPVFDPTTGTAATICRLVEICMPDKDIHPTDAGYRALAALFLQAAGVS